MNGNPKLSDKLTREAIKHEFFRGWRPTDYLRQIANQVLSDLNLLENASALSPEEFFVAVNEIRRRMHAFVAGILSEASNRDSERDLFRSDDFVVTVTPPDTSFVVNGNADFGPSLR